MLGTNSAVIVGQGINLISLNYFSGMINICDSCFVYEAFNQVNSCPNPGKCFVTVDDSCDVCEINYQGVCILCD